MSLPICCQCDPQEGDRHRWPLVYTVPGCLLGTADAVTCHLPQAASAPLSESQACRKVGRQPRPPHAYPHSVSHTKSQDCVWHCAVLHAGAQPRAPVSSRQIRPLREPGSAASVVMEGNPVSVTPVAVAVEGRCRLLGKQMSTPRRAQSVADLEQGPRWPPSELQDH